VVPESCAGFTRKVYRMKSLLFRLFKQTLPCSAAVLALLGVVVMSSPARADSLCPNAANENGSGNYTFTNVVGPLDATCGAKSAVTITINSATDYGRLAWDATVAGYPAGLTLGNVAGASAQVVLDGAADQPFYMLGFTDSTDQLGQANGGDQILMIEFQNSTVSGSTMAFNPNTTLFNLYDNSQGFYLNGPNGQADAHTLDYWLGQDPFLDNEALQQVRIGIGLAGGAGPSESVTVNSLDLNVPEPTSLLLLLTMVGTTGLGMRLTQRRNRRS